MASSTRVSTTETSDTRCNTTSVVLREAVLRKTVIRELPTYATTLSIASGAGYSGANGACNPCSPGFYSSTNSTVCAKCPGNSSSVIQGGTGIASCTCNAGFFGSSGKCDMCEPGTFSIGSVTTCTTCPPLSTSVIRGATSANAWKYNAGYSGSNGGTCSPCPIGTYKTRMSATCLPCPPNSNTSTIGTTTPFNCLCIAGHVAESNKSFSWTSLMDVPRETMLVVSRQGMLFLLVIPYLTYSSTFRPCGRVRRNSGTLTGMDRYTSQGKTGGQQGDPLEMLIFNLTVHHIWGRVLAKFQGVRSVVYTDDGYIKVKLSVVLQVLVELKRVLKEDAGLELNISKTDGYIKVKLSVVLQVLVELNRVLKEDAGLELNISKTAVLSKDITQEALLDVAHTFIINSPQLTQLSRELSLDSFLPDGFVGIGVPIGTDNFVRQFVVEKCRDIIADVEKIDTIEDRFVHFQLLRFCQATRLQHINSHIILHNRCILQQQHVD